MTSSPDLKHFLKVTSKSISRKRKSVAMSQSADLQELKSPTKRRRVTSKSAFNFLGLPHDIQHYLLNEHLDSGDILSVARTCRFLRIKCYDMYLYRHNVIAFSQSRKPKLQIQILDRIPRLAIYILLSTFPPKHLTLTNPDVSVDIDTLSLLDFSDLIRQFFQSDIKISNLVLYFNRGDIPIYGTSMQLPVAVVTLLASLGMGCISFNVEEEGNRGRTGMKTSHTRKIRRLPPAWVFSSRDRYLFDSAARRSMHNVLILDLDLALFESTEMRKRLPLLLRGSSVIDLTLNSPSNLIIQDVLRDLWLPSMKTLKVTVHDVFSITLPSDFSSRNPSLRDVSLLNEVGSLSIHPIPPHKRPILKLPPLTKATFSANYSGWLMADNSSLSSVEVHPVNTIILSTSSGLLCDAIRSMITTINRYSHVPAPAFSHGLNFPVNFSYHAATTSQSTCTCFAGAEEEVVFNVQILHLHVYILDSDLLSYLKKWLRWFPDLTTLRISHCVDCIPDGFYFFTLEMLKHVRSQCCKDLRQYCSGPIIDGNPKRWLFHQGCWKMQ